jgi:HK97 family phage prohead protease
MSNNIDRRFVVGAEIRASADDNTLVINARAVKYGALSLPNVPCRGGRERIASGAFRDSIASGSDVLALYQHDQNQPPLGRLKNGSLKLVDKDNDGLYFQIRLNPAVQFHRDIHALVKDGSIDSCSFGFQCEDEDWSDDKDESGERFTLRTVKRAKLLDCSLVLSPAYGDGATSAQARNISYRFNQPAQRPKSFEDLIKERTGKEYRAPRIALNEDALLRAKAAKYAADIRMGYITDKTCRAVKFDGKVFHRDFDREREMRAEDELFSDLSAAGTERLRREFERRAGGGLTVQGPGLDARPGATPDTDAIRCVGGSLTATREDHEKAAIAHSVCASKSKDLASAERHYHAMTQHRKAAESLTEEAASLALRACNQSWLQAAMYKAAKES